MDDLLADFLTETNESLADLDLALVRLERAPNDAETLSSIFRHVHTIKGTCGFLGLPRLEHAAHAAENVLGRMRDRQLAVSPDVISHILSAIDVIKLIVAGLSATGSEPAGDDTALVETLNAIAEGRGVPAPAASAATAAAAPPEPPAAAPPSAPAPVAPAAAAPAPIAAPIAASVPAAPAAAASASPAPAPASASPAAPAMPPPAAEPPAAEPTGDSHAGAQTIRVTVDVLEDLMTLVSELVLTRNQLLQLARKQENSGFSVPLQRLSQITSDLQEGVMKTRMQPIGNAWNKLPRLVRDLARDLGKKIELVMHGADTELDRQVLELIKDPLTHMVRNSADHGLETPAERRAAGKPETGRIMLNACHEGGHIIIEIGDDGRGLPVDKIKAKALSRGLATEAELAAMSEAQVLRFIFRPGFSTAAAVTSVSGRGVGMDVVKTNIERIGGAIELRSTQHKGTTFTIKIPLTLAIASALIVEAAGERFAIPQLSVVELVRAGGDGGADGVVSRVEEINGTMVLRLRERLLPLINLRQLLALDGGPPEDPAAQCIVVAQVGSTMLGITVDTVFDTEEIVVKPVAPILRHVTMFSGNTILGDGSVIMILDPNGIARSTGIIGGAESRMAMTGGGPDTPAAQSNARMPMLIFRAGGPEPMAVPLGLVARLEHIEKARLEHSSGQPVTQYRGRLMPLVPLSGAIDETRDSHSVLVFTDQDSAQGRDRCMGLVVDEILDVAEEELRIELSGDRPGLLGTAVIAGRATDVIDTAYWLQRATHDWFHANPSTRRGMGKSAMRVLVVEDADFFRHLLVPALSAAGYEVTAVASAAQALQLRDAGQAFDAIVSDIAMPGMDGIQFVRRLREGGAWANLPVIALTGNAGPDDVAAGRDAGFTDYVQKFERDALLNSLKLCLAQTTQPAAPWPALVA